jgi:hypothetical protein
VIGRTGWCFCKKKKKKPGEERRRILPLLNRGLLCNHCLLLVLRLPRRPPRLLGDPKLVTSRCPEIFDMECPSMMMRVYYY